MQQWLTQTPDAFPESWKRTMILGLDGGLLDSLFESHYPISQSSWGKSLLVTDLVFSGEGL